jgi:sigma-E factor negative regulatory protein RseB
MWSPADKHEDRVMKLKLPANWCRGPAAILLGLLTAVPASAGGDEASDWIRRMNETVANSNYEGVLVRQARDRHAVLRIVHRVRDGRMSERVAIIATEGSDPGREFIRNGSEWLAYAPDQRVRLRQTRNRSFGFLTALNGLSRDSTRHYIISSDGIGHIDGRPVQRISLLPRDELRYGYRFWLDPVTALPLKTQLVSRSGDIVSDLSFLSFSTPQKIDDDQLVPAFDTSGFRSMNGDVPLYTPGIAKVFSPRASLLPAGFRTRLLSTPQEEARAPGPRTRFIVSDGIAWVSIFVESTPQEKTPSKVSTQGPVGKASSREASSTPTDEAVTLGAQACYVAHRDGFSITVVGEVPPPTAKAIAAAVLPE